jgi:hypothetical protein
MPTRRISTPLHEKPDAVGGERVGRDPRSRGDGERGHDRTLDRLISALAGDRVGQVRIFDEDAAEVSGVCFGTHLDV